MHWIGGSSACGGYHKVFVEERVEEACKQYFGPPIGKSEYSIAKPIPYRFDFEVAGLVDTPYGAPAPPVVFISSGEHKVLGLHSSSGFQWPNQPEAIVGYHLADYRELEVVPVANEGTTHSIFNSGNNQQAYGGERFERFIFRIIGTDDPDTRDAMIRFCCTSISPPGWTRICSANTCDFRLGCFE